MEGEADDELDPELALWRGIQRVFELSGLPNKKPARALIERLLGEFPGHPQLLAQLAYCRRAEGDHVGAIEAARAALESDPEDLDALTQLAWSQYMVDDSAGAFETTWTLLEVDPDDRDGWELRGYLYLERRDTGPALDAAETLLAFDPENPRAHNLVGEVKAAQGDAPGARASFTEALRLDPESAQAHNGLGTVALLEGDPTAAVAATRRAGRIDPSAFSESIESAATLGPVSHILDAMLPGRGGTKASGGGRWVPAVFSLVLLGLGILLVTGERPWLGLGGLAVYFPGLLLALPTAADPLQPRAFRWRGGVGALALAGTVLAARFAPTWGGLDLAALGVLCVGFTIRMLGALDARESRVFDGVRRAETQGLGDVETSVEAGYGSLREGDAGAALTRFDDVLGGTIIDNYTKELAKSGKELAESPIGALVLPELESEGAFARAPAGVRRARDRAAATSTLCFAAGCAAVATGGGPAVAFLPMAGALGAAQLFGAGLPWAHLAVRRAGPITGTLSVAGALAAPWLSPWAGWLAQVPMAIVGLVVLGDDHEEGPDPAE